MSIEARKCNIFAALAALACSAPLVMSDPSFGSMSIACSTHLSCSPLSHPSTSAASPCSLLAPQRSTYSIRSTRSLRPPRAVLASVVTVVASGSAACEFDSVVALLHAAPPLRCNIACAGPHAPQITRARARQARAGTASRARCRCSSKPPTLCIPSIPPDPLSHVLEHILLNPLHNFRGCRCLPPRFLQ